MKFKPDPDYFEQADRYELRCACEHCAYWNAGTGECIHAYPNEVHRLAYLEHDPEWIIPCKDFELE